MAEFSPMMKLYLQTKEQYKDCVLFYRLGDFYEMFFDDAIMVSKELELTLTGKDCGQEERAPMCGVPYHAAETYISRLVANGHKVAICEQVEDPKLAKGLVKREVIKVVTPGTNFIPGAIDETKNNFLMCIAYIGGKIGVSVCDITTGVFLMTELTQERELIDEINKFSPSEIVYNSTFEMSGITLDEICERQGIAKFVLDSHYFDDRTAVKLLLEHFAVSSLIALGIDGFASGTISAGALLSYLYDTQMDSLKHVTGIEVYTCGSYMIIDSSTRRNLELCETMREKNKKGSLLYVLDKTKTAMGARLLRTMIEQPLVIKEEIEKRQKGIKEFSDNISDRDEIREYLNPVYDLERIMGRISTKSAGPRELIAFKSSLYYLPAIRNQISKRKSEIIKSIYDELDPLKDLFDLIDASIVDEPPITVKEGGIIKEGYNEEVDRLRSAKTEGKKWLFELETEEKEKTGIKNLKIKFNKVFGYYFEVTNSNFGLVPDYFVRKQTLTNAERYTTDRLKELEDTILGAEDRLFSLEYNIFVEIREKIASQVKRIQQTAKAIAALDVYTNLSVVAQRNNYVCPHINTKGIIKIEGGRHPVIETMIKNGLFVDNDTLLDNDKNRVSIITGPNMAGKSTYMRQVALICLMAQMGSFVPARSADIGIVDRIFTRVGASDDLASGQSTFMVEMNEVANILRNATKNSLLILDEIGRGTSTYDGLSIAWAVVEFIADVKKLGAKALFATHYHELTELEGFLPSVNNYCIAVKEQGDDIVFLRKIVPGGADKSYGILVAKLAGIPKEVTDRAGEIVKELSDNDISAKAKEIAKTGLPPASFKVPEKVGKDEYVQMSLFDTLGNDEIISELKNLAISEMTPIEALNKLYEIQDKIKNRW